MSLLKIVGRSTSFFNLMIRDGSRSVVGSRKSYSSQYYVQSTVLKTLWHVWIVHSQCCLLITVQFFNTIVPSKSKL